MAEVPSTMTLQAGESAPDFSLPDGNGKVHSLVDFSGRKALVVAFVCNHCPFVVHLGKAIGEVASELEADGVGFVAISSNDVENYPQDSPEKMVEFATANGWNFPYLYDETQEVARAYFAACTPDFYVFDAGLELTYCGQFDDSRPSNGKPVSGSDLREAVARTVRGELPIEPQLPSSGCNIKWKAGNAPSYFG
ncbi:MAG: thioredoxin family protein [Verrucomicrobiota bacterium]